MKLSITTRLTLTSATLTALVFLPAGVGLYLSAVSGIRTERARTVEAAARNLASTVLHQWDEEVAVEYKAGAAPLRNVGLNVPHWALIRGDGSVIRSHGVLARPSMSTAPAESFLVEVENEPFRVASVPLFATHRETLDDLPEPVRLSVRQESPHGEFLHAKREYARFRRDPTKGAFIIEVAMVEPERILELKLMYDGRVVGRDHESFDERVPDDLVEMVRDGADVEKVSFSSWRAHNAQLIAVLEIVSSSGEVSEMIVNRFGERFSVKDDGLVQDPNSRLWMVTASDASAEITATRGLLATLGLGLPLVWGAIVLVGWYVTRRALSPVKRIVETVEGIELSDLDERLPVGEVQDELSSISTTINRMLDRIEEGYRRQGQFTGDASHELRGPLAKVIGDIDVALSKHRDGEEYREALIRCRKYASGMQRLVESLLWLARLDSTRTKLRSRPFELTDLVADVVRVFPAAEATRVQLSLDDSSRTIHAQGDPELIRVLLQNLIQNALRYGAASDPVEIRLLANNGTAVVEVQDRGDGIPDDQLEHVFSRFYRVDKSRSRVTGGSGLGLSIVHEIARIHGFRVSLQNLRDGGFLAAFSLPVAAPASRDEA